MKRFVSLTAALLLVLGLSLPARAVSTYASCAILMDADSGRVLYGQNIHEPRLIASITKLMTALVAVEHTGDLDQEITILPQWLGSEGSSIYLQAGERITMRGLLYGLLLQSGNDAAVAIACHVAGEESAFAALMNERACSLGMEHSSFANASGLDHKDHYSTAYDMALLARACLNNPVVAEICASPCATVGTRTFYNHNKLLHRCEGCIGMKTGYTERAGRTLVSAARRNGQTLICVTLNDRNDWNDHEALIDYGFARWPARALCAQGQVFGAVRVEGSLIPAVSVQSAAEVRFPLAEGEEPELRLELTDSLTAPVHEGQRAGRAVWWLNGRPVAETELVCAGGAGADICAQEGLKSRLLRWLGLEQTVPGQDAELI